MSKRRFDSVWDAIEDTPQEAASMKVRAAILIAIQEYLKEKNMTQADAASLLGVTQPRVSDLMRGKIELFSLDTLVNMVSTTGREIEVRVKNKGQRKVA
ncbi:MAG: XRE family transcriptional regulator [Betaproteobacteria bacterium]|nr:XRE family transcriptional regulator [Betaproteobacteria bacterium]